MKNQLIETFNNWADSYFTEDKLNIELEKQSLINDIRENPNFKLITPSQFKQKLKDYCGLRGFSFNDLILKNNTGKVVEYLKIQ